jgi:hypothetical protein
MLVDHLSHVEFQKCVAPFRDWNSGAPQMLVALESDSFATVNGVESNKPGRPQSHVQKTAAMRMARADTPVEDP